MKNPKINVITDYNKINDELKEQIKLHYPNGFGNSIIEFTNNKSKKINAIRFETDEKIFMLRLSKKMVIQIMKENNEFDDE